MPASATTEDGASDLQLRCPRRIIAIHIAFQPYNEGSPEMPEHIRSRRRRRYLGNESWIIFGFHRFLPCYALTTGYIRDT